MARTAKVPKTDFDHLTECMDSLYAAQIALNRIPLRIITSPDVDRAEQVFQAFKTIESAIGIVSSIRNERV